MAITNTGNVGVNYSSPTRIFNHADLGYKPRQIRIICLGSSNDVLLVQVFPLHESVGQSVRNDYYEIGVNGAATFEFDQGLYVGGNITEVWASAAGEVQGGADYQWHVPEK